MKKRTFKNMVLSVALASVLFIGVGYAYVKETIKDTGIKHNTANLDVVFTGISGKVLEGAMATDNNAYVNEDGKSASFETTLVQRGDKVLYTVEVYNDGNTDAVVRNVKVKEQKISDNSGNELFSSIPIVYVVEGLSEGSVIPAASKAVFTVLAEYENKEDIEGAVQKKVSVSLDYKVAQK